MTARAPIKALFGAPMIVIVLLLGLIGSLLLSTRGGPDPVVSNSHRIVFSLTEYSVTPQTVSVPSGKLELVAHNEGVLAHNLTVQHEKRDSKGRPVIVASTRTILPGETKSISISDISAGRYALRGTLSNQADLGLTGTLIVR